MAVSGLVGRLRVGLGLDDAQFKKGLGDTSSRLRDFGKRMAVVGAGLSAAGAGIGLAIRGQLNAADDMSKAAQKIGIPTDELSRLSHAADMSGVSMGSLQGAVGRLSRIMADSPDKFRKLGISVRDAAGNMRPTSEVMQDLAEKLQSMPDGAEKTALAMELMGRSGADLIPMLNGGADALQSMMDEADDLGIVITPEMGRAAEAFNDNISRLQKQMGGLWTMIASNLVPVLVQLSDKVVAVAGRFRGMSPEMQRFVSIIAGAILVLGPVLSGLGLMIMTAGPFVSAMAAAAGAVKALSLAFLANPIGLAVAAIAGAALLIYQNWEDVGPWFAALWDSVKAIFTGFKDFVVGLFTGDLVGAVAGLQAAWDGIIAYYQTLWDGVVGVFTFAWENGIKPITDALGMTDSIIAGWQSVQGMFDTVLNGISATFTAAWEKIEPIVTKLTDAWSSLTASRDGPISSGYDPSTDPGDAGLILPTMGGHLADGLAEGTAGIRRQGTIDARKYLDDFAEEGEIRSPSRVMMRFGQFFSEGLGIGIEQGAPGVASASSRLGQSFSNSVMPYMDRVIDRTASVKDAFADMLEDMARRMASSGLNRLMNAGMGALFGSGDAITDSLRGAGLKMAIPALSGGGRILSEGIAQINERGGELVGLPSGATVVPHDLSKLALEGGGTSRVEVALSPELVGSIMQDAAGQSLELMQQGFEQYSREVLPQTVGGILRDPRAEG